jgi:hypothetical protein
VRRDAEALEIPVFESASEAQREAWPVRSLPAFGRRRPRLAHLRRMRSEGKASEAPWRTHPATRLGFFGLGVLGVLTILALFIPSATVALQPLSQNQSVIIPIAASADTKSIFVTGSLPARQTSLILEGTQRLTVTSKGAIPESRARGVARFKNLTSAGVLIPAGTVVYDRTAESLRFVTVNETHLPAGVNAIVETPIEAVTAGASGNVEADSIQGVEGALGLSVAVTNPAPTEGGSDRDAVAATPADRERARTLLLATLESMARAQMGQSVSADDITLTNTVRFSRILEEDYDPPAGQPGTVLTLVMSAEFTAQYVSGDDLAQLAGAALSPSVPPGYVPLPDTLTYQVASTPVTDETGTSRFELKAGRAILRQIEPLRVAALTRGLARNSVEGVLLQNLPLAAPPQLELHPSWWPWMPLIPFRIHVVIR